MTLYPVILSGGSGTRLWPLSRTALPKQLLPLASEFTLVQETVLRLRGLSDLAAPLIVCNQEHRFLIAEQMREIGVGPLAIYLEPVGRNTAPPPRWPRSCSPGAIPTPSCCYCRPII